jgi:hypothetical protein
MRAIIIICAYCGLEHQAKRRSAKYCCNSCRTMACRDRKQKEVVEREKLLMQIELIKLDRARLDMERQHAEDSFRIAEEERLKNERLEEKQREADRKLQEEQSAAEKQERDIAFRKQDEWFNLFAGAIMRALEKFGNGTNGSGSGSK